MLKNLAKFTNYSSKLSTLRRGVQSVTGSYQQHQYQHNRATVDREEKLNLNATLAEYDPKMAELVRLEKLRQREGLELIASENFTSCAVQQTLGSCLVNKYSEGLPGHRYYGGNEIIDEVETLCQKRALKCFDLNPESWGVNVQAYSGTPANFAVYTAVLGPHARLMGLDLAEGGHFSHGYQSDTKKLTASSLYFEALPYKLDKKTNLIDYDQMETNVRLFRPKLIIAGMSSYPRHFDYGRMRKIADQVGAYLMADMAHIAGLVAAKVAPSPFEHCDIVTTTTHKTLRGPRGALIFFRKGTRRYLPNGERDVYDLEAAINDAVFPGLQGGPHQNQTGAIGVALKEAMTPEFKEYQKAVLANVQVMCREFLAKGYSLTTGGSDVHMALLDLRPLGIDGVTVERVLELMNISVNKNALPGDMNALKPGGIRVGSAAMTSRGFQERDFVQVADFIHRGIQLALDVKATCGPDRPNPKADSDYNAHKKTHKSWVSMYKLSPQFREHLASPQFATRVEALNAEVRAFARQFPIPGQTHCDL